MPVKILSIPRRLGGGNVSIGGSSKSFIRPFIPGASQYCPCREGRDNALRFHLALTIFVVLVLGAHSLFADTVSLTPVADTSIAEVAPSNNAGARSWLNIGDNMHLQRNRALIKFDIAGNIPAHARISSATLWLTVTGIPADGYAVGSFDLHRLLRTWGEGTNNPISSPGQGTPATVGEADWLSPLELTTNVWAAPGGAPVYDYAAAVTGSQIVYDTSAAYNPYAFPDPASDQSLMLADVQLWLDQPAANFGWILICEDETVASTARRLGSREDPTDAPLLDISYTPPITSATRAGNLFQLGFPAQAGQGYAIEFANTLSGAGAWQTLTNIAPQLVDTNLVVTDAITGFARFYRLRTE